MLMIKRAWPTRVAVLAVALLASTLGLRSAPPEPHRARLAADLLLHHAARPLANRRVILHGTPEETSALAARHHLQIVKLLGNMAKQFELCRAVVIDSQRSAEAGLG